MTLLLDAWLTYLQTYKKRQGCKEVSESHRNVPLKMSSLRVMDKKSRWKKQQVETEKQQHFIMTENNLLKGFTTKDVWNYDRKWSIKLDSEGRWPCGSTIQESSTYWGIPLDAAIKLAVLFLVVILNTLCSKIFKWIVFCHSYVLLLLFFLSLLTIILQEDISNVTFLYKWQ